MEIERLIVYPIKSMRGVEVQSATLTPNGWPNDRRFVVLQPTTDDNGQETLKAITIAHYNELVRFWQAIDSTGKTLTITHRPADGGEERSIDIPLEPETDGLEEVTVNMHTSPTQAYRMEDKYNDFLSSCLGYSVFLAYIGPHRREVKMSALGYQSMPPPNTTTTSSSSSSSSSSWFTTLTSAATTATSYLLPSTPSNDPGAPQPSEIGFADVAPYLIASTKSMDSVRSRLPETEAQAYDIIKFRPNIVVKGAAAVWEEDFWGQLTINSSSSTSDDDKGSDAPIKLECEHNCARCRSINIDYDRGAQGTGEAGSMLKKLMKDRRVDAGAKWTPVFGRYAFLRPEFEGRVARVGDEVVVTRRNEGYTSFDWKGLSTLPGGGR